MIGDGNDYLPQQVSTAYNLSVNGPIFSLNSKNLAIYPISPFRPRRWKGKIISDNAKIFIINLDPKKRPIAAVADNNEIRNIVSVKHLLIRKLNLNFYLIQVKVFLKD